MTCVVAPMVFVWAPNKLFGGTITCCPKCTEPAAGQTRWSRAQVLHMMGEEAVFIASRHSCLRCRADHREGGGEHNRCYMFCAGSPEAIACMPDCAKVAWPLTHAGKKTLCDNALVSTIRAWATRTRWTAIAAVSNELRATKRAQLIRSYYAICNALHLHPTQTSNCFTSLTAKWVSDIYERDYNERAPDIALELLAEVPGEILAVDWTRDAAARCKGRWMFNALDSNGVVLTSIVTSTTSPNEIAPALRELRSRGLQPKAIYVDDECCGVWRDLVADVWPGAVVVLDAFHAIRRLTQTTTSTRHPWHKHFCKLISDAIFSDDGELSLRFRRACERGKVPSKLARKLKREHVARHVRDKALIEASIDNAIAEYSGRQHEQCGPLLTAKTSAAWECLKTHVRNGCMCDPPGVEVNVLSDKSVTIGGQQFKRMKIARGSSALGWFHAHQTPWLGSQVHSRERGLALVADGAARFNRRRRNTNSEQTPATPPVFSPGLLAATNLQHKRFVEDGARRLLASSGASAAKPVRSISDGETYDLNTFLDADKCNSRVPRRQRSLSGNIAGAERIDSAQPFNGNACDDVSKHCDDTAQAKPRKRRILSTANIQKQVGIKSREAKASKPSSATTPRSRCRICRMVGTNCRRYCKVQWCETLDIPFEEWVAGPFHLKKAESLASSKTRASRAGGARGRPQKKENMTIHTPPSHEAAVVSALPAADAVTSGPGSLQNDTPSVPKQTKCRKCKMVGTRCRRLGSIQWCESRDPSFEIWKSDIYPHLKVAAQRAADKRAARATGVRGRPVKELRTVEPSGVDRAPCRKADKV